MNVSCMASSWRASSWSLQSLCLWRVDVRKFEQPVDPNAFVFFDLRQKSQNIAPFSKRNHVWSRSQRVWNDHALVVFLSLLSSVTSFALFCSPSVELTSVWFCKTSAWEGLRLEAKKLSSVRTRFRDGADISERNLHYVLHGFMLEWACDVFTRPWREHDLAHDRENCRNFKHFTYFVIHKFCFAYTLFWKFVIFEVFF